MISQILNTSRPEELFMKTAYTVVMLVGIFCLIRLNPESAVLFFAIGMRYFYTILNKPLKEMLFYQRLLLAFHFLLLSGTVITLLIGLA